MYKFNPKVGHIDYSSSLRKVLLSDNLFNKKPIVIPCFFHFVQSIIKKMRYTLKIIKGKINKHSFEIIKNIEKINFLPPNFLNHILNFKKKFKTRT